MKTVCHSLQEKMQGSSELVFFPGTEHDLGNRNMSVVLEWEIKLYDHTKAKRKKWRESHRDTRSLTATRAMWLRYHVSQVVIVNVVVSL